MPRITAKVYVTSASRPAGLCSAVVTAGVSASISGNPPVGRIYGTLDWGDGSPEIVLDPVVGGIVGSTGTVTCSIAAGSSSGTLTFSSKPAEGDYLLNYGLRKTTVSCLATNLELQEKLTLVGAPVKLVTGSGLVRTIVFYELTDEAISVSDIDLVFPMEMPAPHTYPAGEYTIKYTAYWQPESGTEYAESFASVSVEGEVLPEQKQVLLNVISGPSAVAGRISKQSWSLDIAQDASLLASNIKCILATEPGERVMAPDFGTPLTKFLSEPLDDITVDEMSDTVRRSIARWEPRCKVMSVSVTTKSPDSRSATVAVDVLSLLDKKPYSIISDVAR